MVRALGFRVSLPFAHGLLAALLLASAAGAQPAADPLAPLVQPKRDFWVGTIEVKRTENKTYHRDGPAIMAHAMAKGDGTFTSRDTDEYTHIAKISIDCPKRPDLCYHNASISYRKSTDYQYKRTVPRVCRGSREDGTIVTTTNRNTTQTANGTARASFDVTRRDGGWFVKLWTDPRDLACKEKRTREETLDQGCGTQPTSDKPALPDEDCDDAHRGQGRGVPRFDLEFSTDVADPEAQRLDGTKWIEPPVLQQPDNGMEGSDRRIRRIGTIDKQYSVTYQLRRVVIY